MNRFTTFTVMVLLLCSCAAHRTHEEGLALMAQGNFEEGIRGLEQAVKEHPENFKVRTDLITARERALNRLIAEAEEQRASGALERAVATFQRVLGIDPSNDRARIGLAGIERDRILAASMQVAQQSWDAGDSEAAAQRALNVLREDPRNRPALELKRRIDEQRAREIASTPTLRSMYDGPALDMKFRDADLRQVFDLLSRESGVTMVFDRDVKPDLRTTIVAHEISFEDAVELLLMSNQLEKKIVNHTTMLIYPVTAEKLRHFQDLAVKAFYLTYADVKQTAELLKAVLKPAGMFVDDKMNMIVLRDTPGAIAIADKLVAMHDLVAPEVMLDLEVLEVQRNKIEEMGIQWPNQLTLSPLPSSESTTTLRDITGITSATTGAQLASMIINLKKESGVSNLLANPRIRSLNHQKANILIGSKVPVVTTTATANGFASQSVQYLDVGLKLEVESSIHLQDEVEVHLALEVSSISSQVQNAGLLTYQIGTRNASTVLRMRDGETQVLAGLINDQDTRHSSGVPGLGDIPIVGRLFRSQRDDTQKTEIVLLITPHLVRNMTPPQASATEFLSGSETTPRNPPRVLASLARKGAQISPEPSDLLPAKVVGASLSWSGPHEVRVGDQFKVVLTMQADAPLKSLPLQVGFDPAVLEILSVNEGNFFQLAEGESNFASNVDAQSGHISLGVSRSGPEGSVGRGDVATLTFRARARRPRAEVIMLSAAAVSLSGTPASVAIPGPFSIAIGK